MQNWEHDIPVDGIECFFSFLFLIECIFEIDKSDGNSGSW